MSTQAATSPVCRSADSPLTRRDLRDALYAKAGVGLVAAVVGGWFATQPATVAAGSAGLIVAALCLLEAAAAGYRMTGR